MARQIFRPNQQQRSNRSVDNVSANLQNRYSVSEPAEVSGAKASQFELHNRRMARSEQILEAVSNLDRTQDPAYRQELMNWIEQAYSERMGGKLVALFARCFLGHPYRDHHLSLTKNVVEHYTHYEDVPPIFREARNLALSPRYAFIEVYSDGETVPVEVDGTISFDGSDWRSL